MAEPNAPDSFDQRLLQQDETWESPRYQEHRMNLEHAIVRAEVKEKFVYRLSAAALLVAAVLFPVCASQVFGGMDPWDDDATILSVALGILYILAISTFFIGLASYYSRYRPGVRRAREQLLESSIREIREELRDVQRRLADTSNKDHS